MSAELQKALQEMGETFKEMRAANDQALDAKASNERVSEAETKLAAAEKSLKDIETVVTDLTKRLNRPNADQLSEEKQEHKEALGKYIRKGEESGLEDLQMKALNLGTNEDGGFALTDELDTQIGEYVRDSNPMREVCRVIPVGNETYAKLFNQAGAATGWVGETDARSETGSPTLARAVPIFGEIYANPATTQKALDDMFFDAEGWLAMEIADEFADEENLAFTTGNGTNKPKGILDYTFAASPTFGQIKSVDSAGAGTLAPDDFVELMYSVKRGYRRNSVFMMSDTSIAFARKMKDGQGNYIWQQSFQAGEPSVILNHQVVENVDFPAIATGAKAVMFGDFQRGYTIADVRGTRILRDPFTNKPYVHFYTTKRVGGGLMDSRALAAINVA